MSLPTVYLAHDLAGALKRGHPWVYRDHVSNELHLPSGTWVCVRCGSFRGYGLWDARSPIAIRIFSRQRVPNDAWVARCLRRAWELRSPIRRAGTTAYRWLYGEGDGLPGVVVDLYGRYAVIETYADSLDVLLGWVVDGLRECAQLRGILWRRPGEGTQLLWGKNPRELVVVENGIRFYVNLTTGQKTGLYLDQRDNRRYLEDWCAGRRVLNCFAYTGAFALYALRGRAQQVVNVDIAAPLAEATQRNLRLNGFDPEAHPFIVADCFELLKDYASQGRRFDMIVLDPPSLARSRKNRHAARRAYVRLNRAAMRCLPPGGLLATASCTAQVSPSEFREALAEAAAHAGRQLIILHEAGHALDHPVPAHFPEGRYLKFVLGRIQKPA